VLKKLMFVMACVLLLGIAGQFAVAQDGTGLQGRSEVLLAAAWLRADAGSEEPELTLLGASYGMFVSPKWEIQGSLIYGKVSGIGSDSANAWLIAPAALYHFVPETPSSMVPYIGAGFAYADVSDGEDSSDSLKLQYMAGVKFFIGGDYTTANKAIFLEYRHTEVEFADSAKVDMIWGGFSTFLK
jgi:hypothetical protein